MFTYQHELVDPNLTLRSVHLFHVCYFGSGKTSHDMHLSVNRRKQVFVHCFLPFTVFHCIPFIPYCLGHQRWLREEALADIVAVEMVDLPVSESQARMEEEFGDTNSQFYTVRHFIC